MVTIHRGQSMRSPNVDPWLYNNELPQSTGHRYFDAGALRVNQGANGLGRRGHTASCDQHVQGRSIHPDAQVDQRAVNAGFLEAPPTIALGIVSEWPRRDPRPP